MTATPQDAPRRMEVQRVEVIVRVGDKEVAHTTIGYFVGQDYSVEVVTPDGKDWVFTDRIGAQP